MVYFIFIQLSIEHSKVTVETLVCTVCLCPIKRTLGLFGLSSASFLYCKQCRPRPDVCVCCINKEKLEKSSFVPRISCLIYKSIASFYGI